MRINAAAPDIADRIQVMQKTKSFAGMFLVDGLQVWEMAILWLHSAGLKSLFSGLREGRAEIPGNGLHQRRGDAVEPASVAFPDMAQGVSVRASSLAVVASATEGIAGAGGTPQSLCIWLASDCRFTWQHYNRVRRISDNTRIKHNLYCAIRREI